jgi:hypothetical protein
MSNLVVTQDLPDFLQKAGVSALTKQLAGKSGIKRIVPKNGTFKLMVSGEEMGKIKGDLDSIIVNASPDVGRIFYAKSWSPDAEPTAPDCFSNNGRTPDAESANPQATSCKDCPQNVKGSGQGQSKACRYTRRIAVLLEQDFGTSLEGQVYQMNLASKSLFGDNVNDGFTFENYAKYLSSNGKSIDFMVTRISFNEHNDNQSVLFTATRHINRAEHAVTTKVAEDDMTKTLVLMTPAKADGVTKQPAALPPAAVAVAVDDTPEPTKRPSKKVEVEPTGKKNLADVVSAWSKEE